MSSQFIFREITDIVGLILSLHLKGSCYMCTFRFREIYVHNYELIQYMSLCDKLILTFSKYVFAILLCRFLFKMMSGLVI